MRKTIVAGMLSLFCLTGVALAATAPTSGRFRGKTSQHGRDYKVHFAVHGTQVKRFAIVWRASCRSGGFVRTGTAQGNTRIVIHRGRWTSSGSYSGPIKGGYTGRFRVVESDGRFLSHDKARGAFHIEVRIFRNGHQKDRCDSGVIHWTARRR
jgi:hypothetical protein